MEIINDLPKIFISENSLLQIPVDFLNIQMHHEGNNYSISITMSGNCKSISYKLPEETYNDIDRWIKSFDKQ